MDLNGGFENKKELKFSKEIRKIMYDRYYCREQKIC